MRFGLRIDFGTCAPYRIDEIISVASKTFPNSCSFKLVEEKGYFDLGFADEASADQAAATSLFLEDIMIPKICTRWVKDKSLFLNLTNLPTSCPAIQLETQIQSGLSNYGRVIGLRLETDPRFPNCVGSRAFAAIIPSKETGSNGKSIPKIAFIQSSPEEPFSVTVEGNSSPCSLCLSSSHNTNKCSVIDPEDAAIKAAIEWGTLKAKPSKTDNLAPSGSMPAASNNPISNLVPFNLLNLPRPNYPSSLSSEVATNLADARGSLEARLKGVAKCKRSMEGATTKSQKSGTRAQLANAKAEAELAFEDYMDALYQSELDIFEVDPIIGVVPHETDFPWIDALESVVHQPPYGV
jgi:hypothetical protein